MHALERLQAETAAELDALVLPVRQALKGELLEGQISAKNIYRAQTTSLSKKPRSLEGFARLAKTRQQNLREK